MKLLLDIGNTRIKAAFDDGQGIGKSQAIMHSGQIPRESLEEITIDTPPKEIWVACVAGPVMQEVVLKWADECWDVEPDFVTTEAQACGVNNAYSKPNTLGVDRWLAIIAAHHRGKGPACVVDAGTCLTLDVVDAKGRHLGGLIAPGVASQRDAVWGRTQVRARTQDGELGVLADSTDDAVSFGTLHGPLGLIERVCAQLPVSKEPMRHLITGGETALLLPYLEGWEAAPDLVLEGLAILARASESE